MKPTITVHRLLLVLVIAVALVVPAQVARAQAASATSSNGQTNDSQTGAQQGDQSPKTFTGVIVKSGSKLVLNDTLSKTSYQLDDQVKAQDFLNQNVRVTGVLDPSTGTIRVSAVDPS
jgi:photosystem II stability/assembly factor-like uncharacterized protein